MPVRSLQELAREAAGCRACPLWKNATQTVFGEGPDDARVLIVGEQPGDAEDREGHPFVGPAGRLLDEALVEAGLDRAQIYVTNAVKHFKWVARGKRRLHERPNAREIRACRPWLEAEIAALEPTAILCLGATAAASLLGGSFRVTKSRGQSVASPWARHVIATVHPASLLRIPDAAERRAERERFVADLRVLARLVSAAGRPRARAARLPSRAARSGRKRSLA
jgi:DNA polymerase